MRSKTFFNRLASQTKATIVSAESAKEIIDTRTPLGKFIVRSQDTVFTCIDNSKGEAWTEDFTEFIPAKAWLNQQEEQDWKWGKRTKVDTNL